jgi:predicted ATPase
VAEVLASTTHVQILATSRIPLRIAAEQEYPVLPLDLPNPHDLPPFEHLSQYDAVALFIARARAIRPDFMITNANAPAVAEMCVRLDGLPLALELAAARIRLFPPEQLLSRLVSGRMQTLTGGARDLPARQQTIRATIDWSYRLLTPPHQRLFMRLGVFVGGWTLAAAEIVCAEDGLDVAEGVQTLVEQSLVRVVETNNTQRFILLETLREYALERLAEAGEETETRQRHAEYFVALVETVGSAFGGPQHAMVRDQLDPELPNLRAAFAWFQEVGDHELALHFASALLGFWLQRGDGEREGREILRAALSPPGAGPPLVRARALSALGRLSLFENESWPETVAALEESLAIFRELGNLGGSAEVLDHLHLIASYRGDTARAKALIEESLRDSRLAGNPERLAWALANAADHAFNSGDDTRGHALLDESLNVFTGLKHILGQGYVLFGRAAVTQRRGDNRRALALFAESASVLHELGPTSMLSTVLFCHGQALLWEGDYDQSVRLLEESLAVDAVVNGYEGSSLALNTLGEVALAQGDHATARARFRESQAFSHKMGDTWYSAAAHLGEGYVALDEGNTKEAAACYRESLTIFASLPDWDDERRRLGVAAALAALTNAAGYIASERMVRLYAAAAALRTSVGNKLEGGPFQLPSSRVADEQVRASMRTAVGDAAFDAAWADGQALTLKQAVEEALAFTASPATTV